MTMILSIFPSVFSFVFSLLIISLFLSSALAIYAFRMKENRTASIFGSIMILSFLWSVLKIFSLFIFSTEIREILHLINILLVVPIPPLFFIVAVYYTKYPKWFNIMHIYILFIIPVILIILVLTSSFHHLLFSGFTIIIDHGIPMHFYKMNIGYYLFDAYIYMIMAFALVLLVKSVINKDIFFRRQMLLFIIGGFIPLAYDVLFTVGISPLKNYNLACVFISIGNVFFAWSLFGYRFFKLVPITRNVVVEKMSDIMVVTNHEDLVIDINKSGKYFFDLVNVDVVGGVFFEIFKKYPPLIKKYFDKDNSINEIAIQKENKVYHYSISITPVESGDALLANIIILHDITERIKSEIEIKQLSIAVEQSPVSIITTDITGKIEYINEAFCKTTGYSPEESLGENTRILKGKTSPNVYATLWETLLSGQIWKGEFINKKKNGEFYYSETTISPIKNDKNQIIKFIAIMEDITERKQAELRIQRQNIELIELNATKDKFFSIIAHDLKNPFNSILGLSNLLINNFDSFDNKKIKEILGYIDSTANQTYNLLENLLEWSRIQQGKLIPKFQKHNLKIIASEMEALHAEFAKNKNISIKNNIKSDIYVLCDVDMTKTILRNLISNAIKFTKNDGTVSIIANQKNSFFEIQIEDNGLGIAEDKIQYLFLIETNSSTAGTNDERGSGLGLILCKEMVEKQGGKIWVESKLNIGSTVFFTIEKFIEAN